MNKSYPIIIAIAVIAVAVAGFAAWKAYNPPPVVTETPENTTNPTNNTDTTKKAGFPTVQTDSNSAPYISTVVVKGTVNPNGAATTYWYEYGKTNALGTSTSTYIVGSGYTTMYTPAYITGLQSNTDYYFRLSAKNLFGTVNGATYSFRTNTTPAPDGVAPTTSTSAASDVARTSANLHGRVNPKGSETTFWFEYGPTAELGFVTALQSAGASSSTSTVSVSVSNLQPLTKYYFRVNAQNQFGTINGQILNFTTKGPAAAAAPAVNTNSASAITDSSAKLNGNVNPNGAATTYWFEYSSDSLLGNVLVSTTPQQSLDSSSSASNVSANISNLDNDTKYYFRIVAKNQYGTVTGDMENFTTKK